jgi:hypothetical protein
VPTRASVSVAPALFGADGVCADRPPPLLRRLGGGGGAGGGPPAPCAAAAAPPPPPLPPLAQVDPFDKLSIKGLTGFAPGTQLTLLGKRPDGSTYELPLNHTFNENQIKVGAQLHRWGVGLLAGQRTCSGRWVMRVAHRTPGAAPPPPPLPPVPVVQERLRPERHGCRPQVSASPHACRLGASRHG